MVVGPEFGPLAGVCVGLVQRRPALARRSAAALAVGFPVAVVAALVLAALVIVTGIEPAEFSVESGFADLIASPDVYSVIVAAAAGVAGMLSLSTAKSAALVGVLVSVTTLPAAAEVGVAAAEGEWGALGGAAAQLGVNVVTIIAAGTATLLVQRAAYRRRRTRRRTEGRVSDPARATPTRPPSSALARRPRR